MICSEFIVVLILEITPLRNNVEAARFIARETIRKSPYSLQNLRKCADYQAARWATGLPYPERLPDEIAAMRVADAVAFVCVEKKICLLYTSPSPRDGLLSRMPSSA